MNSGVYKLTFNSGKFYIGKSVDIPTRWQQHGDSFGKCIAAKLMQAEFDNYGAPTGEVLVRCHPDHIDIVEACLIARLQPELNTSRPPDPFEGIDNIWDIFEALDKSTIDHLRIIYDYSVQINSHGKLFQEASKSLEGMSRQIEYLEKERSLEEIQVDKHNRILSLERVLKEVVDERDALLIEKTQKSIPWWKKIFN